MGSFVAALCALSLGETRTLVKRPAIAALTVNAFSLTPITSPSFFHGRTIDFIHCLAQFDIAAQDLACLHIVQSTVA